MALPKLSEILNDLIAVLDQLGGQARPSEVYPLMTARFPLSPEDLAATLSDGRVDRWTNRIQWARQALVNSGDIDSSQKGIWRLTERGMERAHRRVAATGNIPEPDAEAIAPGSTAPTILPTKAQAIIDLLTATEHGSSRPVAYELAVLEGFTFLGYEASHVGGPGDTDLIVEAPLGIGGYSIVVDAKSTGNERVAESQINWPAIVDHRKGRRADYAVVIAASFAAGNLLRRATEFAITLVTTVQLSELLELHQVTPFGLDELRTLFVPGEIREALAGLRDRSSRMKRRWRLLAQIIEQVQTWHRLQPTLVLAQPMTLFAVLQTTPAAGTSAITLADVEDALTLLSSSAVGVLRAVEDGSGYVLSTTPTGARQKLLSLVRALDAETSQSSEASKIDQRSRAQ